MGIRLQNLWRRTAVCRNRTRPRGNRHCGKRRFYDDGRRHTDGDHFWRRHATAGWYLMKTIQRSQGLLVGESLFMTAFTNIGTGKKRVSFPSPSTGKIMPVNLQQIGGQDICQKDAFLCAAKGVSISIEFQRRLVPGYLGEKDLLWNILRAMVWHFCIPVVTLLKGN